jgi:hypothetical protein
MAKDIQFEIKGLDKLERKFAKLGRDFPGAMRDMAKEGALFVHSKVPPAPSARPGSRYIRTNKLLQTLTAKDKKISRNEYAGVIGSSIEYAPYVISDTKGLNQKGPQAWFHKGVWKVIQDVIRENKRGILDIYRERIAQLLKD